MPSYKDRTIDPNKPVRVYRNLHKNSFSVVQGGLVVAHADQLCLRDAKPFVSEIGRERVINSKRKEVHAWIEGYLDNKQPPRNCLVVKYNPYKYSKFCVGPEGQEQALVSASNVWFNCPIAFIEA